MTERTPTLLEHRRFVRVVGGQIAGAIGDQLIPVALSVYVVQRGGSAAAVAGVLGGRALGLSVCLVVGGMLADRFSRSKVVAIADAYRAGAVLALAILLPYLPITALGLGTVLIAAGEAIARPGYRALVPSLLPAELLERGNAVVSAGLRGSAMLGTLSGASTAVLLGPRLGLVTAGVVFALGAFTVLGVREKAPERTPGGLFADAREGVRAVRERPWMVAVMAAVSLQILFGTAAALTLLPIVANRSYGGGFGYGVVLAALTLGALPAVFAASRWRPRRRGAVSMVALVAYGFLPLSLAVPLPFPVTVLVFALGGFGVELFYVYWLSALQRSVRPELLGRVLALDQLTSFALLPLGYALVAPSVALLGEVTTLVVSGVIVSASSVLALAVPGVASFADRAEPAAER